MRVLLVTFLRKKSNPDRRGLVVGEDIRELK